MSIQTIIVIVLAVAAVGFLVYKIKKSKGGCGTGGGKCGCH